MAKIWNGRLPEELVEQIKDKAFRERRTQTDVVREALERHFEKPPPAPVTTLVPDVLLIDHLVERTDQPRGLLRAKVKAGRVAISGTVYRDPERKVLAQRHTITLDGKQV